MSALDWLSCFLEKRNCLNGRPDGRPLFAYRCTRKEFENLKSLLVNVEKNVPGSNLHLSTGYLFTLYCSEWWRRYYSGGAWKWAPIVKSLGWDHNTWNKRTEFILKGLRYWKRDLIKTSTGTQYLLSVASEGGIPINVLEREGASFKYFLKAVIREYGQYASLGLSAECIARDNLYRLPLSWRQDQIATLAGQIIEQVWTLKSEIDDSTEPLDTLNKVHPNWDIEFPLALESEQAAMLINSLLNTAQAVASGNRQVLRVERNLDIGPEGWFLSAKLLLPKELNVEQIKSIGSVTSSHEIPERMEMYRVIGDERILVARLSGEGEKRFVRPVPGATQSYTENADKEIGLVLVARGQEITSLPIAGGTELDSELPWCFIMIDEDMKQFRWVGQGGCQRREPDVFLLSSQIPKALTNDGSSGVDMLKDNVLGRRFWKITQPAELVADQDDELYRIEPGLERIAERDYRLIGERLYFPQARYTLYRSVPNIQLVNDDSVYKIATNEFVWRPIGTRHWRCCDRAQMIGDIEIRHRQGKVALASWKLSIISEQVQIQVEPVSHLEGVINLFFPNAIAIAIYSIAGLEVSKEQLDGRWRFHCKRHDVSIGSIRGDISWKNDCNMSFSLPYPAEGVSFVNGEGKEVYNSELLTLSRLYGYRAQVVSPNNVKKYSLRGYLSTKTRSRPALEHHKFEYPMAVDKYGMSTLPLQQLKSEIERLFAVSTGVDDTVKLELLEASSLRAEASVMVQQFEGVLYPDKTRRMIQLSTYSHMISEEYAGMSLKLISINDLDFEPLTLEWNELGNGWTLPDYDDERINLSHTYFASVNGNKSYSIRPCVVPPESHISGEGFSKLAMAMTWPHTDERLENIREYLSSLIKEGTEEEWCELCSYLKRFSCIHPDGLDLIECLLDFPEIIASVWFRATPDQLLRDYLQMICDASPFSWWMISTVQWVSALNGWLAGLENLSDPVKNIFIDECKKTLNRLSDDNEEMNSIVDVLLEMLGETLSTNSLLSYVRAFPSEQIWTQLDQMSRGLFISGIDGCRSTIGDVFTLRRELSSNMYHYIQWPANDMNNIQKSVIQAPVIAAAALRDGLPINENQRIALLAARNYHPVAFATLFRATQAVLWVNQQEIKG